MGQIRCSTKEYFVFLLEESVTASQLPQVFHLFFSYSVTATVLNISLAQPFGQCCRGNPTIGSHFVSWFFAIPGDFHYVTAELFRECSHDNILSGTPSGVPMLDVTKPCTNRHSVTSLTTGLVSHPTNWTKQGTIPLAQAGTSVNSPRPQEIKADLGLSNLEATNLGCEAPFPQQSPPRQGPRMRKPGFLRVNGYWKLL